MTERAMRVQAADGTFRSVEVVLRPRIEPDGRNGSVGLVRRIADDVDAANPIDAFLAETPTPARIRAFMESRRFPIVEGASVTFVWRGASSSVRRPLEISTTGTPGNASGESSFAALITFSHLASSDFKRWRICSWLPGSASAPASPSAATSPAGSLPTINPSSSQMPTRHSPMRRPTPTCAPASISRAIASA